MAAAIAVGATGIVALQSFENAQLRELIRLRRDDAELARLRAAREALGRARLPASELETLRADRAALARLRSEIEALKVEAEKKSRPAPAEPPPGSLVNFSRPAGRATPHAVLATALWSARSQNLDTLAETLWLEPAARTRADRLLGRLGEMQSPLLAETGSPEKLVAWFTARSFGPGASLRVMQEKRADDGNVSLAVVIDYVDEIAGKRWSVGRDLKVQREGNQWKLVVPESAVQGYAASVEGPRLKK
jgi:hypothetical protein